MTNKAAQQLGRLGGLANTPAQNAARAANGKLGGRPRKKRRPAKRKVKRGASPNKPLEPERTPGAR